MCDINYKGHHFQLLKPSSLHATGFQPLVPVILEYEQRFLYPIPPTFSEV